MTLPKRNTNNSKNAAKDEKENESQVITMAMIKSLFHELFEEQEVKLAETIKPAADVTNKRIDKLLADIMKNNERLAELTNDVNDVKESIDASQEMLEKRMDILEEKIKKEKQKCQDNLKLMSNENKELREKLRNLEDRSRRDNLRFSGIEEYQQETWDDTEQVLKDFLDEHLGLRSIGIERPHRVGPKVDNSETPRTIVVKFSSFKAKELILKKANQLKGTGYYISEAFSKETLEIRKENWKKVKQLRENGKYAVLVYDKAVWRERNPTNSAK